MITQLYLDNKIKLVQSWLATTGKNIAKCYAQGIKPTYEELKKYNTMKMYLDLLYNYNCPDYMFTVTEPRLQVVSHGWVDDGIPGTDRVVEHTFTVKNRGDRPYRAYIYIRLNTGSTVELLNTTFEAGETKVYSSTDGGYFPGTTFTVNRNNINIMHITGDVVFDDVLPIVLPE